MTMISLEQAEKWLKERKITVEFKPHWVVVNTSLRVAAPTLLQAVERAMEREK